MIQYIVNKKKKAVVAFDNAAADNFVIEIAKFWDTKFGSSCLPNELIGKFRRTLDKMKKIRGVAKCSPLDNFSEDIGLNLAEARLVGKLSALRENFYLEISRYLSDARDIAINRYFGNEVKELKYKGIKDDLTY